MKKKFLTLQEQVNYLNKKKILTTDEDKTKLIRVGYFNVINGYKSPFSAIDVNKKRVYEKRTTFQHLLYVNDFDNNLRHLLFMTLTKIEQEIRNVVSYFFEKSIDSNKSWKSIDSYSEKISTDKIALLVKQIDSETEKHDSRYNYVNFYKTKYNELPIWIVTKTIKFTTFIKFIKYCKDSVYLNVCNIYGLCASNNSRSKTSLISILQWIRIVRNYCAHNERTYCLEGNKRLYDEIFLKLPKSYRRSKEKKRIIDVIIYCRYFLSKEEYFEFIKEIKKLFIELEGRISKHGFNNVRAATGIKDLSNLDFIAECGFDKNYLKFC